jgi:hypothetical protein
VSLYSYALGSYFAGEVANIRLRHDAERLQFVKRSLGSPLATAATILLLGHYSEHLAGRSRFAQRTLRGLELQWSRLHAETAARLAEVPISVRSYFSGDVRAFLNSCGPEMPVISFPPFFEGGYETMFKHLDAAFDWPRPAYEMMNQEDAANMSRGIASSRTHWLVATSQEVPDLEDFRRALIEQRGHIPMIVYGTSPGPRYRRPAERKTKAPGLQPIASQEEALNAQSLTAATLAP